MKNIYFDNSLPLFAKFIQKELGSEYLKNNFFLRDATGVLSFIVLDFRITSDKRVKLSKKIARLLGNYVGHDGFALTTADELFDDTLKDISIASEVKIESTEFTGSVLLFERRLIGADWLRDPKKNLSPKTAKIVFSSVKGGVGRSTALCVVAAALSRSGKRVLAIDMDLEAPGLGNMLLKEDVLPIYGLLDYFVEKNLYELGADFFIDIMGPSWISQGRGRVDVVPALGRNCLEYPQNVLSKIARAYLSKNSDGIIKSFMDYMDDLIGFFSLSGNYDVILIDARSGLHETTASAMVGLNADIFCFGIDQPQTITGYELLFSHLSTFSKNNISWANKLHFVHAKAQEKSKEREKFSQLIEQKIIDYFIDKMPENDIDVSSLKDTFEMDWNEADTQLLTDIENIDIDDKINPVIPILDDNRFQNFNPLADSDSLSESVYTVTFGPLLERVRTIVSESIVDDNFNE
ncbi:tyrosine-protein kinase family protein [Acerihabitans arboris]|uniref:AAA family ATPase n=1 Tax=Acerihabitans arboris TaxID=2691583 RepID=A0A845SK49_9GAMM|nr:ParA family protein [Acerihabitans arboris]NDL63762.1 AAA family ATPase [Acerihabitans arboris]